MAVICETRHGVARHETGIFEVGINDKTNDKTDDKTNEKAICILGVRIVAATPFCWGTIAQDPSKKNREKQATEAETS